VALLGRISNRGVTATAGAGGGAITAAQSLVAVPALGGLRAAVNYNSFTYWS
jgi:hypothetical protein